MKESEYIESRLNNQIDWYSSKSSKYKSFFYALRSSEMIIAAFIPILFHWQLTKSYIPLLGAIISILAGVLSLFRFHESWISYRITSESLKYQKYLYLTNTFPYNNVENKLSILVGNVESIISSENSFWKEKKQPSIKQ